MSSLHDFPMKHKDPRDPYVLPQVPEDDPVFYPPALLIQHPRAAVVFDPPPPTAESIARAKAAMEAERRAIGYQPPPSEDADELCASRDTLRALVRRHGGDRVIKWARFEAWIDGHSVSE